MTHTILYYGNFDRNFHRLTVATKTYLNADGEELKVEHASKNADGLRFRYMEMPFKQFVAVGVEEPRDDRRVIVLRAPVLLISERHTDGKGFFNGPHFGDDSAMNLLVDMIVANPEYRDALGLLVRRLGA
jgi:hypothetical protein